MAGKRTRSWKRILLWVIGILLVVFALVQVVPYGRSHSNPPAVNAFNWTDPQAEAIARVACYDCHSNGTNWWWATNIAPFSWLVQADVDGGRRRLNFSEYHGEPSLEEFQRAVEGGMPPFQYTIIHPSAKLNDAEKRTLINGYADGIAASGGSSTGGSANSGSSTGGSQRPPAQQGSTSTTAPSTASADAVGVINQVCSGCHSARPALSFHAGGAGEAQALIGSMVRLGAKVTPEQQQLLVQYYTR